jgi:hypothetical protein
MNRTIACLSGFLAYTFHSVPANAADGDKTSVTSTLVCKVQHAIRWREAAWPTSTCKLLATAFNRTPAPILTMAIAILESDLRPRAISAETRPSTPKKTQVHGRSKRAPAARALPEDMRAVDIGLMGIRCIFLRERKCLNGPARGLTVEQLKDPETNIAIGARILASKRSLQHYNGGTSERGYAAKVYAVSSALEGLRVETKHRRIKKLIEQILTVLEPRDTRIS